MDETEKVDVVTPCMDVYNSNIQYDGSLENKVDNCSQRILAE